MEPKRSAHFDPASTAPGRVLYGLAGWSYDDWKGIVYPSPAPRGFDPIGYLARFVDVLEINSSFYRIPSAKTAEGWARKAAAGERKKPITSTNTSTNTNTSTKTSATGAGFQFTMKLWQGFTHGEGEAGERDAVAFDDAARPLAESGALGCVLMQFPWSFRPGRGAMDGLRRLMDRFASFPLAVEVRHSDWLADDALLGLLRERGAAFCNIDQPALRACLGLTDHVTAPFAYFRLHGRNSKAWFAENASAAERYDYFYSPEEIADLARIVAALKAKAKTTFAIANNHFRGDAAAAILQLKGEGEDRAVAAPASLVEHFGGLGPRVVADLGKREGEGQLEMF